MLLHLQVLENSAASRDVRQKSAQDRRESDKPQSDPNFESRARNRIVSARTRRIQRVGAQQGRNIQKFARESQTLINNSQIRNGQILVRRGPDEDPLGGEQREHLQDEGGNAADGGNSSGHAPDTHFGAPGSDASSATHEEHQEATDATHDGRRAELEATRATADRDVERGPRDGDGDDDADARDGVDGTEARRPHGIREGEDDVEDDEELQRDGKPPEGLDDAPASAQIAEGVRVCAGIVAVEVGFQFGEVDGAVGALVAGAGGAEAVGRGVLDGVEPLGHGDGEDAADDAGDGDAEGPAVGVEEAVVGFVE